MTARALGDAILVEGGHHLRAIKFALSAWSRQHRLNGMGTPASYEELRLAVDRALAVADPGPADVRNELPEQDSWTDVIDSGSAAQILGCSERHTRRIATSLGGKRTRSGWIFDRTNVIEYRDMKEDDR